MMQGEQETVSCSIPLLQPSIYPTIHEKQFRESKAKVVFFFLWWSLNSGVVRSRAFSDVFLPLPPSLCADDSSSNVLRLSPCSPGPGLDLPCPPLTVPLLFCYSYRNKLTVFTACSLTRVWVCLCASWATEAFVLEPLSRKRQLLLSMAEGCRESGEMLGAISHTSSVLDATARENAQLHCW